MRLDHNSAIYDALHLATQTSGVFTRRAKINLNSFLVFSPYGHSLYFDEDIARTAAAHLAGKIERPVIVLQINALVSPALRLNAQPAPPSESGEPPDGRTA